MLRPGRGAAREAIDSNYADSDDIGPLIIARQGSFAAYIELLS